MQRGRAAYAVDASRRGSVSPSSTRTRQSALVPHEQGADRPGLLHVGDRRDGGAATRRRPRALRGLRAARPDRANLGGVKARLQTSTASGKACDADAADLKGKTATNTSTATARAFGTAL